MIMGRPWIRRLEAVLSNDKGYALTFGERDAQNDVPIHITATGSKYVSSVKDQFTVEIDNLTYAEILQILNLKLFNVKINAGYRTTGVHTVFKGSVAYVSHKPGDDGTKTNTVILLCTSRLLAVYGQSRMNLKLSSGVNMYSAVKFLASRAGIKNPYIDSDLRARVLKEAESVDTSLPSFLESFAASSDTLLVTADSSGEGADLSFWDIYRRNRRKINLTPDMILLNGGYPRLTNDGLTFSMMPMFNLCAGDTVTLDNSLIDISVRSTNDISSNYSLYLDPDSQYVIYELSYNMDNRRGQFMVTCRAKARSLYQRITGGS